MILLTASLGLDEIEYFQKRLDKSEVLSDIISQPHKFADLIMAKKQNHQIKKHQT